MTRVGAVITAMLIMLAAFGEAVRAGGPAAAPEPRYVFRPGASTPEEADEAAAPVPAEEGSPRPMVPAAEGMELKLRVRELCRQLLLNAKEPFVEDYVLTVNSFVNLNNLYATSTLGRYLGEQMIGELQTAGADVIDVRKSAGVMIREGYGEYGLSRRMEELSYIHASQAMVVGTYTRAEGQLFLNVRVLRNSDGLVLSHGAVVCPLDPLTVKMLADEAAPPRPAGVVGVLPYNE